MKQNLKNIFLVAVLPIMAHAKYHLVRNDADFDRLINQYEYSVVCFAPAHGVDELKLDHDEKQKIKDEFQALQNRVKAAAGRDEFKTFLKKDVGFLVVDSSSKKTQDLPNDFAISKFPTCLVFKDGALVNSKVVAPQSASDLIKLLQKSFGTQLDALIKERKEDDILDRQERIASYYSYGSSAYAWYPYAYWPYSRWGVYPYGLGWGFDAC